MVAGPMINISPFEFCDFGRAAERCRPAIAFRNGRFAGANR
jgi:hypothetical protein